MGNGLKEKLLRPKVEQDPLIQSIRDVCRRMEALETQFGAISDNDLLEACIYEMEALRAQYRFLLRRAKEMGVSGNGGEKVLWEL
jgi:hypothetical protein